MTWEVHQADCLDVMRSMAAGSVDAVITDPPYGVAYADWDAEVPPQVFLDECLRVARGSVVWFGAAPQVLAFASYDPRPDRMLIWAPAFSLAKSSKSWMFYRYHPIWCWRMPRSQRAISSDVLRHNCEGRHWWDHPATKPVALMDDLLRAFAPEGGTVLDPFCGSGTTGVACVNTGRRFIGIEREPQYVEIARRRLTDAAAQPRLEIPA